LGTIDSQGGDSIKPDQTFLTSASVLFDGVYVPGGAKSITALKKEPNARTFIKEAYEHCKPIAADNEAADLIALSINQEAEDFEKEAGVHIDQNPKVFIDSLAQHRIWSREQ
jgi:catalase